MAEVNPYDSPGKLELAAAASAGPQSVFELSEFRHLLSSIACSTLASQALLLVVRYQVYEISKSPLSLGLLGLVEAIPALTLVLLGGHIADRYDRRRILQLTTALLSVCAVILALVSQRGMSLAALYATVFAVGVARSFAAPANSALEAQVVPVHLIVKSATWFATTWLIASVVGPVLGGHAYDRFGAIATYIAIAALYAMACFRAFQISPKPHEAPREEESIWESIRAGVAYVVGDQVLLGSMALDLFAVLFGGAIAILPIYAAEILHVDTAQLGMLTAAPNAGALVTMLLATRYPPVRNAGRNLLLAVVGFGVCMLIFAVSKNFYLSLVMLFLSGVFDGISVVIRKSIVRLLSPNYLRGRIAAVSLIFIGSSNEIGALESGLAAAWLGTVPSVLAGGTLTLVVAGVTAILAPKLRRLRLDQASIDRSKEGDSPAIANC